VCECLDLQGFGKTGAGEGNRTLIYVVVKNGHSSVYASKVR
jgi:hypothetical protein